MVFLPPDDGWAGAEASITFVSQTVNDTWNRRYTFTVWFGEEECEVEFDHADNKNACDDDTDDDADEVE